MYVYVCAANSCGGNGSEIKTATLREKKTIADTFCFAEFNQIMREKLICLNWTWIWVFLVVMTEREKNLNSERQRKKNLRQFKQQLGTWSLASASRRQGDDGTKLYSISTASEVGFCRRSSAR